MSIIGFAASLFISPPQLLGSGSSTVPAPDVRVIRVEFTLDPTDPSKVLSATARVQSTTAYTVTDVRVYFLVKDASGKILGRAEWSDSIPPSPYYVTIDIYFSPEPSASEIASVAVTVVPA
jgi:hypothetical protein